MQTGSASFRRTGLALYGGSFDPVHNAHLALARRSLDHPEVDRVVFIPAAKSPLKSHAHLATDAERLAMLRLALGDESRFCLDAYEIERGGVSYSVDTVRHFDRLYPEAELYWIVGADQFERLSEWYRINELVKQVRFLVFARSENPMVIPAIEGLRFERIKMPIIAESSSQIRSHLEAGRPICGRVPEAVEAFISGNGLYKKVIRE